MRAILCPFDAEDPDYRNARQTPSHASCCDDPICGEVHTHCGLQSFDKICFRSNQLLTSVVK